MKAMIVNAYGEDAGFEVAEIATPEVKAGHVLVKIAASSVNTVDTMIRTMGKELPLSPDTPAILGMDFAGTVEAVGDGVEGHAVGDEVYGCAGGLADLPGTLAEFICADARLIAHKPKNLSMREAAALPLVAITAYEGLVRAGTKAGISIRDEVNNLRAGGRSTRPQVGKASRQRRPEGVSVCLRSLELHFGPCAV